MSDKIVLVRFDDVAALALAWGEEVAKLRDQDDKRYHLIAQGLDHAVDEVASLLFGDPSRHFTVRNPTDTH